LDAVADADGEDEERHQNRERVDAVAEGGECAELPDDGDEGAKHGRKGEFPASGVVPDQEAGHDDGDAEQENDATGAIGDVADDFGEADDVDGYGALRVGGDAGADFFEGGRDLGVVEFLAGSGIDLEELGGDDSAREVVGDELTEFAGLDDVFADLGEALGCGGEVGGDDVAAGEAVLDDLDEADVGRVERLDLGAVDAREVVSLVGDGLEGGEVVGGEDVALGGTRAMRTRLAPPNSA